MDAYKQELIDLACLHRERTGRELATIATLVMNDGKFFTRLQEGGGCTMKTYAKVKAWFRENTPKKPKKRSRKTAKS